jgi:hypothetical protein
MFNQSFRLLIVFMLAFLPLIGEQSSEQMRKSSPDFEVCPLIPNHNRQKKCHRSHKKFFKCCEKGPKGPRGPAGPIGDTGATGPGPLLDYASFVSLTPQTLEGRLVTFETVLVNGLDGSTGETSSPGVTPDLYNDVFTIQVAGDYAILFGALVALSPPPCIQDSDFANSAPPPVAYFVIQKNGEEIPGSLVAVQPGLNQSIPVSTAIFVANLDVDDRISVLAIPTAGAILLPLPVITIPSQTAYIAFARLGP